MSKVASLTLQLPICSVQNRRNNPSQEIKLQIIQELESQDLLNLYKLKLKRLNQLQLQQL